MASALLSASFALFLVRERENASKNVQMISGAPVSVFWLSTFLWDLLNFSLPAAGDPQALQRHKCTDGGLLAVVRPKIVCLYARGPHKG